MSFTPDESPSDLWLERSNFVGGSLECIAYGVFVMLYFMTTYYLVHEPAKGRRWAFHIIYISLLFAVTTLNVVMTIKWDVKTWIDNRNYPGGPVAFAYLEVTELIVGNATYIINNFMTDALVLYRCLIIWEDNYAIVVFPLLMFLASTALSIVVVYQTARPGANLWSPLTANVAVPYWALSISLNIVVTLLISGRLFMMRKRMREVLGPHHAKKYTSAIAMLIESAALYSVTGLMFLITYARNSYVQNLVLPVLCVAMPAAPLLILLRVASGNGFSRDTTTALTFGEISDLSDSCVSGLPSSATSVGTNYIPNNSDSLVRRFFKRWK